MTDRRPNTATLYIFYIWTIYKQAAVNATSLCVYTGPRVHSISDPELGYGQVLAIKHLNMCTPSRMAQAFSDLTPYQQEDIICLCFPTNHLKNKSVL